MLLKGTANDTFVNITGYYIPKQRVTGASVANLDDISRKFIEENGIVATIHSHSTMNVFFSTTDDEMTNKSAIKFHVVVNNRMEFCAKGRMELPCGMSVFKDAEVMLEKPELKNVIVEGLGNIERETPPQETWNTGAVRPHAPINDPDYGDYDQRQYEFENNLPEKKPGSSLILRKDKEILTSSVGTQEGGYVYDVLTDTYILDDGTVIEGLKQEWDANGERLIHGTPPTTSEK